MIYRTAASGHPHCEVSPYYRESVTVPALTLHDLFWIASRSSSRSLRNSLSERTYVHRPHTPEMFQPQNYITMLLALPISLFKYILECVARISCAGTSNSQRSWDMADRREHSNTTHAVFGTMNACPLIILLFMASSQMGTEAGFLR